MPVTATPGPVQTPCTIPLGPGRLQRRTACGWALLHRSCPVSRLLVLRGCATASMTCAVLLHIQPAAHSLNPISHEQSQTRVSAAV
jgi:hypothetical protein